MNQLQQKTNLAIELACKWQGIDPENIHAKTNKQEIVKARQLAFYLLHKISGISQKETGFIIGVKDHATVLHGCRQIQNMMDVNKHERSAISAIIHQYEKMTHDGENIDYDYLQEIGFYGSDSVCKINYTSNLGAKIKLCLINGDEGYLVSFPILNDIMCLGMIRTRSELKFLMDSLPGSFG